MTIKTPCILSISDSGRIAQIFHTNGRLITELLVHGPLLHVAQNCEANIPITKGRPNVFRGELFGLAGYEYLNVEQEKIEEKI
jgi:hypothetical protein